MIAGMMKGAFGGFPLLQNHKMTMHTRLMMYLIVLIIAGISTFTMLLTMIWGHLGAEAQIAKAMENQIAVVKEQMMREMETYTGYGLQLSRELKQDIEGYLEEEGITISDLNDNPDALLDLEKMMYTEPLYIVLFISHDETLIERTANMVIHIEQIIRKTKARYTVAKLPYRRYVEERLHKFEIQKQRALSDRREKKIRDEKYQRVMQSVQGALRSCTRQAPSVAKNLKDKMHTVKAMERRFEKEDENMTQMPEQEEAIFVKLGDENSHIPAGKTVIEYELSKLVTPDGKRILAEGIHLKIKGSEKICMIGANGAGKTTLLKKIAEELLNRNDIKAEYMPQTYEDLLDLDVTPVDYLDKTGDKEERTRIRTYLGSLKYTPDEMEHPIRELSGGQKAKVLLLRMSLSGANVLILDEPTRNFSPLSGPVIRKMLREFPGAVISISHDRKYIEEVCDKIYQLNPNGLQLIGD